MPTMQRNPFTPPGLIEYGGQVVVGTPEETIWNQAFETARARIDNPRWLAPGISFEGQTGNIDAPEMVTRQVFAPAMEAFEPQLAAARERTYNTDAYRMANQDLARRRLDQDLLDDARMRQLQEEALRFRKDQAGAVKPKLSVPDMQELRAISKKLGELSVETRGTGAAPDAAKIAQREALRKRAEQIQSGLNPTQFVPPDVSQVQPTVATNIPARVRYRLVNGALQQVQ